MPLRHWSNSSGDDSERQFRDVRRRWIPPGAGTPGFENETWSLEVFGCDWCHPSPLDFGFRRNDECEGIPSDAGMTRPTVVTETIHPGSEPGTCFRTNRPCRLVPAHQGMKMRPGRWRCSDVVGATLPLWIPASARMTNSVAGDNYFRTNDGG